MSFHGNFVNADYGSSPLAGIYEILCPSLRMRKRAGVWELDPNQFDTEVRKFLFYDEVSDVDPDLFLAHTFDHSFVCKECGITEKEVREARRHRGCPGKPYRYRVLPFFNYHVNRNDGWRVVNTEQDSYVTVQECDDYLDGRIK